MTALAYDSIHGNCRALANQCWAPRRLAHTGHSRDDMLPDDIARWRRVVDDLAAAGDRKAAGLQQIEE